MKPKITSTDSGSNTMISTPQRFLHQFHIPLLIAAVALVGYGLVVIYSASLALEDASVKRQAFGVVLGLIGAVLCWSYDLKKLASFTTILLVIDIVLIVLPLIPGLGVHSKGINGWIQIPGVGIRMQPAELAKLVTIVLLSALVSQYQGKIDTLKDYIKLCAVLCVPFLLILAQPDLGTGLIILVFGAMIIALGGAKRKWVLVTLGLLIAVVALVLITDPWIDAHFGDNKSLLKNYQMNRLLVFIDPSRDPSGSGYNLQQSKIAVGSAGFFGKGIGNATQSLQGFLPEAHTDFVFALLSEEFGFVGAGLLLVLYLILIFSALHVGVKSDTIFGSLICIGVATMWGFQVLQNVGMCIGIMPITGIPLPFISFGSSSMLAQLMAVGMVASIWRYRTPQRSVQ